MKARKGKEKASFFEKKELSLRWSPAAPPPRTRLKKVFCFFFSKKKPFLIPHPAPPGTEAGFTLIEVLVAFIIAALALAVLFQGSVGGMRSTRLALHYEEALSRAQSHMAGLLVQTGLRAGRQSGADGGGFHWITKVTPMGVAAVAGAHRSRPALYALLVTVSWRMDGGRRSVTLHGARLGTVVPGTP